MTCHKRVFSLSLMMVQILISPKWPFRVKEIANASKTSQVFLFKESNNLSLLIVAT